MFRRVAQTIAAADMIYNPKANTAGREEEFYHVMTTLEFLTQLPYSDECRAGTGAAFGLLCPAYRGLDGVYLQRREIYRLDS